MKLENLKANSIYGRMTAFGKHCWEAAVTVGLDEYYDPHMANYIIPSKDLQNPDVLRKVLAVMSLESEVNKKPDEKVLIMEMITASNEDGNPVAGEYDCFLRYADQYQG